MVAADAFPGAVGKTRFSFRTVSVFTRTCHFQNCAACSSTLRQDLPTEASAILRKQGTGVLAIGYLESAGKNRLLILDADTDQAEKILLESFNRAIAEIDPDVIEGHNLFKFDLDYLRNRCKRHKVLLRLGSIWPEGVVSTELPQSRGALA